MSNKSIDISHIMLDQLILQGKTAVLGLGTFSTEYHGAKFNDDRSAMEPPRQSLRYEAEMDNDYLLQDFAVQRLGLKAKKIEQKLNAFAEQIVNQILNYGNAHIDGVGVIAQDDKGNLFLEKSEDEAISAYFGLPSIPLKPISFIKEATQPKVDSVATLATDDGTGMQWWHYVLALLLAALMAGMYTLMVNDDNEPPKQSAASIHQEVQNEVESEKVEPKAEIKTEAITDTLERSTNPHAAEANLTNEKKGKLVECVIILGAFESAKNVENMYAKVTKLGYEPYREYFEDLGITRVGFNFTCEDKDLQSFMREVRKKVSPDAWYLVPRITVD